MRDRLASLDLVSYTKLTGGKGVHVVAPIVPRHGWKEVRDFSQSVSAHLARTHPALFVTSSVHARRRKRIYLDYLRNARGATAIVPYGIRARPGAPAAVPVSWRTLVSSSQRPLYTIEMARRYAGEREDPWSDFFDVANVISSEVKRGSAKKA